MRFVLLTLVVVCLPIASYARIGETQEECVKRYGPPVERLAAILKQSDPEAVVFSKAGIAIVTEFKGGKVWRHTYRIPAMDDATLETVLSAEAGESRWGAPIKIGAQYYRSSSDGLRIAIATPGKKVGDTGILVVAEKAYAEANSARNDERLLQASEVVKKRSANKPIKDL